MNTQQKIQMEIKKIKQQNKKQNDKSNFEMKSKNPCSKKRY